ncbi:hypothetical protein FSP39_014115 [Pinctada imbricata]|uniref:CCHC-type domain-containing protein n=1 Tax=Pinctada imbricata TaxID=66713 RepID=A0AA89C5V0_PINIB|nr:hypothetical protein FSP39_014115 [Pinctada imbricata]
MFKPKVHTYVPKFAIVCLLLFIMGEILRDKSVHFYHKQLRGISHDDVLESLKKMNLENAVSAIQITEDRCIVTCKDTDVKTSMLIRGLEVKNNHVQLVDVENTITNVTIKDAPYELGDNVIYTFMSQYGNVVDGSLRRGTIKGTSIENGSRYLSIVGCVPTLPNRATIGRFDVRIFANNNRTPCIRCNEKGHPSYKCPKKDAKLCHICKDSDHLARDCPRKNSPICFYCNEQGHMQRNCPTRDVDLYGEYATEIREGREEPIVLPVNRLDDIPEVSDQAQTLCAESRAFDNTDSNTFAIILGASNARRMSVLDKDVVNASVSGATLSNIGQTIDKAHESLKNDAQVEKVVICLGTNDVSQNKSDPEQVILNLTSAINETKKEFPVAEIGLCGIIPRKGT